MASQEEIDSAIGLGGEMAVGGAGGVGVDEDELADELAGLVEEEKRAEAERRAEEKRVEETRAEADKRKVEEEKRRKEEEERVLWERRAEGERRQQQGKGEERQKERERQLAPAQGEERPMALTNSHTASPSTWENTFDAAQQRDREEKQRAEIERVQRDGRRMPAE